MRFIYDHQVKKRIQRPLGYLFKESAEFRATAARIRVPIGRPGAYSLKAGDEEEGTPRGATGRTF